MLQCGQRYKSFITRWNMLPWILIMHQLYKVHIVLPSALGCCVRCTLIRDYMLTTWWSFTSTIIIILFYLSSSSSSSSWCSSSDMSESDMKALDFTLFFLPLAPLADCAFPDLLLWCHQVSNKHHVGGAHLFGSLATILISCRLLFSLPTPEEELNSNIS